MSLIKDTLKEFRELFEQASLPLQNLPTATKAGMEGKIRAAQAKLPEVRERYQKLVTNNAVFIAVTGSAAKEFATKANERFGAFAVDYDELANMLYDALARRSYGLSYSVNTHSALLTELGAIKGMLGLQRLAPLPFYNSSQNTDVKGIIKKQLDEFYDGELNCLYVKNQLGGYALREGFDGGSLPVIIYGYEGTNYAKHLNIKNEIKIEKEDESKEITQEEVAQTLNFIKKEVL
jgi:uncharacterized protein YukJ